MLGNDVVDINFCEAPRHRHIRYLDRVCTTTEAEAVRRSDDPVRALAAIWASKEATFKMFSKLAPGGHFVPRNFATQIHDRDPACLDRKLTVVSGDSRAEVSLFFADAWVHAVAATPATQVFWTVSEIRNCAAGGSEAKDESQAARFLAGGLMAALGVDECSLDFAGRIPRLTRKGVAQLTVDVSLSHHGAFAAAAMALPARGIEPVCKDSAGIDEIKSSEASCSTCTVSGIFIRKM